MPRWRTLSPRPRGTLRAGSSRSTCPETAEASAVHPLAVDPFAGLTTADHDRRDHRDQQQHRDHLEEQPEDWRRPVHTEQDLAQAPGLLRPVPWLCVTPILYGQDVRQESTDPDGGEEARPVLSLDDRPEAPHLGPLREHDPEQDDDRDGTDVDEDLESRERRGVEHHEEARDAQERSRHEQGRMHYVAAQDHPERRDQGHRRQEDERDDQAAVSFLGASLAGFFFFTVGLGSMVGSTGRSPNWRASSRRL